MPDQTSPVPYVTQCPVGCDTPLTDTDIILAEGALRACPACGQLVSRATAERYWATMADFNQPEFNDPRGRALDRRRRVARRRLEVISRLAGKSLSDIHIVDVGCSRGQFVAAAVAAGCHAEGVEPAPVLAEAARAQGLTIQCGLLEDIAYPAESFDAVTLFEVVEHLRDPAPLLAECRRILRPGGVLVVSTGNTASITARTMRAHWDYFDMARDGGHISFFNPGSLSVLGSRAGFAVARVETARVKFHEKGDVSRLRYTVGKLIAETLNWPARILGLGHDMVVYFRRPA